MVVCDDEVDAEAGRKCGFLYGRDAVVHRDDEAAALIINRLDRVLREAVAVALPAGQHTLDGGAHPFQVLIEQGRGGHTVHVVVAEDDDRLPLVDGPQDALPPERIRFLLYQDSCGFFPKSAAPLSTMTPPSRARPAPACPKASPTAPTRGLAGIISRL